MDKSAQIEVLRKEHINSVNNFDFDRAEQIEKQIQRLRTEISRDYEQSMYGMTSFDLDEQREKILGESARTNATLMQKRVELQQRFHERYKQLQERHTQQETDLSLEHTAALEREAMRPIQEVDKLLSQSKVFGRDHQYAQAKALYQEAMKIKDRVNKQRKMECDATYQRTLRKLKDRQRKEMNLLSEKQEAAIEELNMRYSAHENVIQKRMNVKQLKATQKNVDRTVSSRMSTSRASARRSASVTRTQRSSRLLESGTRY